MVFVILLIFFTLIIPLLIEILVFYDKNESKLYFSLYLYGFIKLISGYFTLEKGYIAFHTAKKAYLIAPSTLINTGKKYKKLKHFEIYYINSKLILGNFEQINKNFLILYNFIVANLSIIYKMHKNFSNVKNDIILYTENIKFKFCIKIKFALNMVVIIIILFKKLTESLIYGKKSKKGRKYNR